jgi:predicted PurR-regulated permease PerM
MENEAVKIQESKPTKTGRWFAGYVVAGLIWTFAQSFKKNTVDEFIVLVVAIGAGFFYHRIKSKIKIKNEAARIIVTFIIIEIIAGALIGFSTTIANRWQDIAVRTPLGTDIAKKDGENLTQLNRDLQTYLTSFQPQWDAAQNSIDEKSESRATYSANVASYRNLLRLNNERYTRFVQYSDQVKSVLSKYSSNLMDAFSQMVTAAENTKNA